MKKSDNVLIGKLFFRLLPVQILLCAMSSVNSIVDGVMAGRFIDAQTVGVIGLYYSMVEIFTAIGLTMLGGSAVLCGRYIGKGEHERTEGIFSLNITVTFITGAVLTALGLLLPGPLAVMLGADAALKDSLVKYIIGYSIGVIPMLLAQQLSLFLQLEGRSVRGYAGVAGMIISNIILDILFIVVFKMGIFGLALATSVSNIIYFLILAEHYISGQSQLKYGVNKISWDEFSNLIFTGFPGALLVLCIAIRYIVINRVLLFYSGNDGLAAMASFNMVAGIYISFCLGCGQVLRMLSSVFIGEEDRKSIKTVVRISLINGFLMMVIISVVLAFLAPPFASLFFPDRSTNVYYLASQIFFIYTFCLPPILIAQVETNYLQALGHKGFINFVSIFDGFFSVVVPAVILAPVMGAYGVWISNFIGVILTILLYPVYCIIFWKRFPANADEWLFLPPDFGAAPEDSLNLSLHSLEEVSESSEKIQNFAKEHYLGSKLSYYSALCLEEMAGNVIEHGFEINRVNSLTARYVISSGKIMLRIKDDCKPFNPGDFLDILSDGNSENNIGIKMVYKIADDVNYQNMLGLNVLTITINEENLLGMQGTDFLLERYLKKMAPDLHGRFRDTVFASNFLLSKYRDNFPEFTDHSELHSMTVIDFCNRLIGPETLKKMNPDEVYILLSACYLHDIGMGVGEREYDSFKDKEIEKEYFEEHPDATRSDFIRAYHNEFSGTSVEKNAEFFEIPTPEHAFAIKQVVRGHRKTNLYDEKEYPSDYCLPNGNKVCLPHLSALIRLADEIDFVASRNPVLLYDIGEYTIDKELMYALMTAAVKSLVITEKAFIFNVTTDDEKIRDGLKHITEKMQHTLNYCRSVVESRTDYSITQEQVILNLNRIKDV